MGLWKTWIASRRAEICDHLLSTPIWPRERQPGRLLLGKEVRRRMFRMPGLPLGKLPRGPRILTWMVEERPQHGMFRRKHRTLTRMAGRRQRGAFLPGRRIHTQVEVGVEEVGIVEEVEEVGAATTGGVRRLDGRTTTPVTGRQTRG